VQTVVTWVPMVHQSQRKCCWKFYHPLTFLSDYRFISSSTNSCLSCCYEIPM